MAINQVNTYQITCDKCSECDFVYMVGTPTSIKQFPGRWFVISTVLYQAATDSHRLILCVNCLRYYPVDKVKAVVQDNISP